MGSMCHCKARCLRTLPNLREFAKGTSHRFQYATADGRNPFCTWKPGEAIVSWYLQGINSFPGFLGGAKCIPSIRSRSQGVRWCKGAHLLEPVLQGPHINSNSVRWAQAFEAQNGHGSSVSFSHCERLAFLEKAHAEMAQRSPKSGASKKDAPK